MSPLLFSKGSADPKLTISLGRLPGYVSSAQAPTKKAPWRTIREVGFCSSVSVALSDDAYEVLWDGVHASMPLPQYAKVTMKLENVLEGDFFNEYIKIGNVVMISEGGPGVDDRFSLKEGILRLELCKESYERAGLQGTPLASAGRKHVKARYLVEINLRLPSMLHGKKGFDRLVWAAKNALNQSLTWLFVNLDTDYGVPPDGPLNAHFPTIQTLKCSTQDVRHVLLPTTLTSGFEDVAAAPPEEQQESVYDLLEYLDMLFLGSPRVQATDRIDPFLSRYAVPDLPEIPESTYPIKILTWTGLIPSRWIMQLTRAIIKNSRLEKFQKIAMQHSWLAISVGSYKTHALHQTDGYTLLLRPKGSTNSQGLDEEESDLASELERNGADAVGQARLPQDHGQPDKMDVDDIQSAHDNKRDQDRSLHAGFYRYLCAEYSDTLT